MGKFFDWLDHRTGFRRVRDALLIEHIPGGARWGLVWGSCLAFVFFLQLVTGVLLMTAYVPSEKEAWGSVHFIQYQMDFGWLIRGLHHFGSQTMVVLLGLHMLQVVIAGAHLPPREVNWWLGLILMALILGLSLTGYLLPWDQKGYYATRVATNILGGIPLIGDFMQKVLVGGSEYGNQTLTHFFALHVGILPPLVILFIVLHLAAFRRHGVTYPKNAKGSGMFWPDQAFRDMIVCLVIFGVMLGLVVYGGHGHKVEPIGVNKEERSLYERWAKAGQDGLGANLDAPADRLTAQYPARPEWYFLSLFQLLKYFKGDQEIIGTVILPGLAGGLLFILPLLGIGRLRKFGHAVGVLVVVALLCAVGVLTLLAIADDSPEPLPLGLGGGTKEAKDYRQKLKEAEEEAQIAVQAAMPPGGVPPEGTTQIIRGHPLVVGKRLFKQHCASCHAYDFKEPDADSGDKKSEPTASDLTEFANTEKWVRGLLEKPDDPKYFGRMPRLKGMVDDWRYNVDEERMGMTEEQKKDQDKEFDEVAWWVAQQAIDSVERTELLKKKADYAKRFETGKGLFEKHVCHTCHHIADIPKSGGKGPDLTGYGSQEWVHGMVLSPGHKSRYGGTTKVEVPSAMNPKKKEKREVFRNAMPAFRPRPDSPAAKIALQEFLENQPRFLEEQPGFPKDDPDYPKGHPDYPKQAIIPLSDFERELIVRFLMRDNRVIFGGQPIAAPPKDLK